MIPTAGLLLALGLFLQAPAWAASPAGVCPDCNIVLIAIDTLRPDHLGCYGYPKATSPHIDRLAARGVVFDDFIAPAILTPISMASMFTSRYPAANGYTHFSSVLDTATVVLPEVLKTHGYETAAFLTSPEFYKSARWRDTHGQTPKSVYSFGRGFGTYDGGTGIRGVPGDSFFQWLENNRRSKFFLWLPIGAVHSPYGLNVPTEIIRRFHPQDYQGQLGQRVFFQWSDAKRIYAGGLYPEPGLNESTAPVPSPLTAADHAMIIAAYDAGVSYTDAFIGKFLEALQKHGLDRKTIVIILSEHAEDLGEHGYYTHYDLYNTELKIPLIIVAPGLRAGRVAATVSGVDLAPTILEMAGIPAFHQAQGRSVLAVAAGASQTKAAPVFSQRMPPWELLLHDFMTMTPVPWKNRYQALLETLDLEAWKTTSTDVSAQDGRWKLIHRRSRSFLARASWWGFLTGRFKEWPEYELYDLKADPGESRNLAAARIEEAAHLKQALAVFEAKMDRHLIKRPATTPKQWIPYP